MLEYSTRKLNFQQCISTFNLVKFSSKNGIVEFLFEQIISTRKRNEFSTNISILNKNKKQF